jgi:uncharacterized membrane protein (DUF2068 family)
VLELVEGTGLWLDQLWAEYLRSVFTELDVHTRLEAIATAQRLGLLAPQALGPQPTE